MVEISTAPVPVQVVPEVPVEPEVVEPTVDRPAVAVEVMGIVRGMLHLHGRIKRPRISKKPKEFATEWVMTMVSPLLARNRQPIGTIRVVVRVPKLGKNVKVRIDWTRDAFGFWFREEFILRDAVQAPRMANLAPLTAALVLVRWTVDGSVRLKSMNRMLKKVKKNTAKDRMAEAGLVLG